jgi:hypothetical protein
MVKDKSVSGMLSDMLIELVAREDGYEQADRRICCLLRMLPILRLTVI